MKEVDAKDAGDLMIKSPTAPPDRYGKSHDNYHLIATTSNVSIEDESNYLPQAKVRSVDTTPFGGSQQVYRSWYKRLLLTNLRSECTAQF